MEQKACEQASLTLKVCQHGAWGLKTHPVPLSGESSIIIASMNMATQPAAGAHLYDSDTMTGAFAAG